MSDKKIDLLDDLLSIEGEAPVELNVGGHALHVRRAHTGVQVVEWQTIEAKRADARNKVLSNTEDNDADKVMKLADIGIIYLKEMLKFLCDSPTTSKDVDAVVKLLKGSSGQLMDKVAARIFFESGLFTEDGKHVPFTELSETESNTDD